MVIIAWSPSGSLSSIFEADVFRNVLTIFITAAFLNFLQGKTLLCDSAAVFYLLSNILHFFKQIFLISTYMWNLYNPILLQPTSPCFKATQFLNLVF
jgi:callose synthase